jgi:MFS family permease
MFFFGVAMLSLGPILAQLGQTVEGANRLPGTMSIGIFLGTILFGPVVDRFGYKWLLILSSIFALAGLQGLANFDSINLLHLSIFCLGFGGGILNGETNALVSDIYDDSKRGGRLGLLGAVYCIGALVWVLMNTFIPNYRIPLNILSVLMALFIIYFILITFPEKKISEKTSRSSVSLLVKSLPLYLFSIILFFESGLEGAQANFTISYFLRRGGLDLSIATFAMTWFTIGMLAGRLPLGKILNAIGPLKTLYTYLSVTLVGVALLFWGASVPAMAYVSMALLGFGVGATYPVILNFIGGAYQSLSGTAMSIALGVALVGQYVFNMITGTVFDNGHYSFLPALLSGAVVCIMLLVPVAVRSSAKKQ